MAVERLAEPVARLGVQAEMLDGLAVGAIVVLAGKRIKPYLGLQRPARGEAELHAHVRRGSRPINRVCLQGEPWSLALLSQR